MHKQGQMPTTPSLTLTQASADQQARVHTHTHTEVRIHTHTKTHRVHPQVLLPAQSCICPGARPSSWTVNVHNLTGLLCFPEHSPSPQPSKGQGRGSWQRGYFPAGILSPVAALQG